MASKDRTTSYPCPQPTGRRPGRSAVTDPGHPLFGRRFVHLARALTVWAISSSPTATPWCCGTLRPPVWSRHRQKPLTKLYSHAITEPFLLRSNARCYALQPNPTLWNRLPHVANLFPRRPHGAPPGGDRCTMPTRTYPNICPQGCHVHPTIDTASSVEPSRKPALAVRPGRAGPTTWLARRGHRHH